MCFRYRERMRSVYFVPCPLGVEVATENELAALGAREIATRPGGIRFRGDRALGYAANLWLRSAIRVQELLFEAQVEGPEDLYNAVRELDWRDLLSLHQTLAVDASVQNSEQLRHSKYAALVVKDAIVDQFREHSGKRPDVDRLRPDLPLKLVVQGREASLWRNLSGASLHKRGYRDIQVKSPLNEAIAAGLLQLSGWDRNSALADPMCGSGTFVIEAAMLAADRAPGLMRDQFAFETWPDFDESLFAELRREAAARARDRLDFVIQGADHHAGALDLAKRGARLAGVSALVRFEHCRARDWTPAVAPRHIVTNPPYGERLGSDSEVAASWQELGNFLHRCGGAHAWVLSGNPKLTKFLGLKASSKLPVKNGPIDCRWVGYEIGGIAPRAVPHAPAALHAAPETAPPDAAPAASPVPSTEERSVAASPRETDAESPRRADPSPWVEYHVGLIAEGGKVLDLACGSGRHVRLLLDSGHDVVAIDRDLEPLGMLAKHKRVVAIEADLETEGAETWPLADERFDGILVTNYLWRPVLPRLLDALGPGGVLIYETFQVGQESIGRPQNPDYLLRPNELLELCLPELEILSFESGRFEEPEPVFRQRICARRSTI